MIDLYEILEIDPSKSLSEIQAYLDRNKTTWVNNAHNRNDAESIQKVKCLKEAYVVFSSQVSRDKYDEELREFQNPSIKADPREIKCKEFVKRADEYISRKEFDLAEKAINQAMAYCDDDNIKVLKMAALISDRLNNTEQALNYINKAIVISPQDQQNYKLKLLILLHDFDIAMQAKFYDEDKLTQKAEVIEQYIQEGFIRGMNPQSDKEYLETCNFILESNKKLKNGFDFLESIRSRYQDTYMEKALSVGEEKYYEIALSQFLNSRLGIPSLDTFQYCQNILKQSPNFTYASDYIQWYERFIEAQRLTYEMNQKKLKELDAKIQKIKTEIKGLEDTIAQIDKTRSECEARRNKLLEDTQGNGILFFIFFGLVTFFVSFVVIALVILFLEIPVGGMGLVCFLSLPIAYVFGFSGISKVIEIPQLKQQSDSLWQQRSDYYLKLRSLEDELRECELAKNRLM